MKNIILQGDFGKDPDDELALLLQAKYQKEGFSNLIAVNANLFPSIKRAKLAKSQLLEMDMKNTPVFIGSNTGKEAVSLRKYEFAATYYDSKLHLQKFNFSKSIEDSDVPVVIILNSIMTDFAIFLESEYDANKHKIEKVIMQGDCVLENGIVIPGNATNNRFDMGSAKKAFTLLQKYKIPFYICSREVAYKNPFDINFYNKLPQKTIVEKLKHSNLKALESLYILSMYESGDKRRGLYAQDRNVDWFFQNIAKSPKPSKLPKPKDVCKYISTVNIYDVFTVFYANEPNLFSVSQLGESVFQIEALSNISFEDRFVEVCNW